MENNALEYKGYIASLNFSLEDDAVVGRVINSDAIIAFHGNNIMELKEAFRDMIDSYLAACKTAGIPISKPYSGEISLNLATNLHKELRIEAAKDNISFETCAEQMMKLGLYYKHHNTDNYMPANRSAI